MLYIVAIELLVNHKTSCGAMKVDIPNKQDDSVRLVRQALSASRVNRVKSIPSIPLVPIKEPSTRSDQEFHL